MDFLMSFMFLLKVDSFKMDYCLIFSQEVFCEALMLKSKS